MHALHDLKKQLIEELEGFAKKGEISKSSLETIDTLAHAAKNLCKVIEACEEEEEYSHRMSRRSNRSYDDGGASGQREPMSRRYAVERGRAWSVQDERTIRKLEELKNSADENVRRVIDRALEELRG